MNEFDKNEELTIEVGDFVKIKKDDMSLFVVTDVYDYSEDGFIDIVYELVKIFPINKKEIACDYEYQHVTLHSKMNSNQYKVTYNSIKKMRKERAYKEEPVFMEVFNIDTGSRDVDYSSGRTVDECLDMLNNLEFLHSMFGDKEYKDNKKVVLKRLEELTKDKKKKK